MAEKIDDLKADQNCITKCVAAFIELSRHYYELNSCDSAAVDQGGLARIRVYNFLVSYLQEHKYL